MIHTFSGVILDGGFFIHKTGIRQFSLVSSASLLTDTSVIKTESHRDRFVMSGHTICSLANYNEDRLA